MGFDVEKFGNPVATKRPQFRQLFLNSESVEILISGEPLVYTARKTSFLLDRPVCILQMMETKDHLLLLKTNWDKYDEKVGVNLKPKCCASPRFPGAENANLHGVPAKGRRLRSEDTRFCLRYAGSVQLGRERHCGTRNLQLTLDNASCSAGRGRRLLVARSIVVPNSFQRVFSSHLYHNTRFPYVRCLMG